MVGNLVGNIPRYIPEPSPEVLPRNIPDKIFSVEKVFQRLNHVFYIGTNILIFDSLISFFLNEKVVESQV